MKDKEIGNWKRIPH